MFKYIYKIKTEDLLYGIHILEYSETMNQVYVLDYVDKLLTEVFVSRCKHNTYKQANARRNKPETTHHQGAALSVPQIKLP